ncbi:hypothetical protein ACROYT_G022474 [Oculina patagonica]
MGTEYLDLFEKLFVPNSENTLSAAQVADLIQFSADVNEDDTTNRHKNVFDKGMGTIKAFEALLRLQDGAKRVFCKARPVLFALHQKVEEELDRLESLGVVKKVARSDSASAIDCVSKKDGSIRNCGDFKGK